MKLPIVEEPIKTAKFLHQGFARAGSAADAPPSEMNFLSLPVLCFDKADSHVGDVSIRLDLRRIIDGRLRRGRSG